MHQIKGWLVAILIWVVAGIGQTDSLNIYWQKNTESNMSHYLLFRGVNSSESMQLMDSIAHPNRHYADKKDIQPGNSYFYSLKAVNDSGKSSDYSDTVSVGLPKIIWGLQNIAPDSLIKIPLRQFIVDADDSVEQLTLSVSATENGTVQLSDTDLVLSSDGSSDENFMQFVLTVSDPDSFWDQRIVRLKISNQPNQFSLSQNYPNPFNPVTTIEYFLDAPAEIHLTLYNELGQRVRNLFSGFHNAGSDRIEWDGSDDHGRRLPSGIYFCRLQVAGKKKTIKITFLR